MAHYRKIDVRIWNDEKFRELSDDGKFLFFFVLTHPHLTSVGAMRATIPGLAAEIGWDTERVSKGFREGLSQGLVEHDPKACFIGVPNFLKYNPPDNPNVVKSFEKALELLPECKLKSITMQRVKGFRKPFKKGSTKGLPKGMSNREQEQEQEQDREQEQEQEGSSCSEADEAASEPLVTFPCVGKVTEPKEWHFTASHIAEWTPAYPGVDLLVEAHKALAWIKASAERRKTARGMARFITGWFSRSQNRGSPFSLVGNGTAVRPSIDPSALSFTGDE